MRLGEADTWVLVPTLKLISCGSLGLSFLSVHVLGWSLIPHGADVNQA